MPQSERRNEQIAIGIGSLAEIRCACIRLGTDDDSRRRFNSDESSRSSVIGLTTYGETRTAYRFNH